MLKFSKLAAIAKATTRTEMASTPALDKLNEEKLSRRAALRRIGMTSGIAVLGLLTVDDLARVAAKKLEQNELTRGIAQDFKSAGIAFAGPSLQSICDMGCDNQYTADMEACGAEPHLDWRGPFYYAGALTGWGICRGQADSGRKTCHDTCTQF